MNGPKAEATERRVSGAGIDIGRLFGVPLRIDWSLLIIFGLITVELSIAVFPSWHPNWHPAVNWGIGLAAATAFFASILIHELCHAVVARSQGLPVSRVTLFLFGGFTQLEDEPTSPKNEFWMAIVGPFASAVIGAASVGLGLWIAGDPLMSASASGDPEQLGQAIADLGPGTTLLLWLGPVNLMLAVFNLVPGFPLDGGRVLRSILWAISHDLRKATRWASRAGQVFAWTLMAFGAISLFTGNFASGLWLLLIGWFLNNAARLSYQQLVARETLKGVPVSRVMRSSLTRVTPELSVANFVRDYAMASDQIDFPVESEGKLLGLVSLEQVREAEPSRWGEVTVSQIMVPVGEFEVMPPDAEANDALSKLVRGGRDRLLVVAQDSLLGLISSRDLLRWLHIHEEQPTAARA